MTFSPLLSVKGIKTNGQWREKFSFFHFCPHFKSLKSKTHFYPPKMGAKMEKKKKTKQNKTKQKFSLR
jgi:hypothetical protein